LFQLLSKVTIASCSFYIKCSMCSPCCWTTHCVVTDDVWFSIVAFYLRHWYSQGSVATHLKCSWIFSDSILLKNNVLLILAVT